MDRAAGRGQSALPRGPGSAGDRHRHGRTACRSLLRWPGDRPRRKGDSDRGEGRAQSSPYRGSGTHGQTQIETGQASLFHFPSPIGHRAGGARMILTGEEMEWARQLARLKKQKAANALDYTASATERLHKGERLQAGIEQLT